MSSLFARNGIYYAKVRRSSGQWVARTCETRDRHLARSMARMVDELAHRGKQTWDLLDSVAAGDLSLPNLYSSYSSNRLEELRERLHDVDLSPLVDEWLNSLAARLSADTIQHYRVHVRTLYREGQTLPSVLPYVRETRELALEDQRSDRNPPQVSRCNERLLCLSACAGDS